MIEKHVDGLLNGKDFGAINRETVFSILEKHRSKIPQEIWCASLARFNKAFTEFYAPEGALKDTATSAFFVHTRRHRNGDSDISEESLRHLDDSSRFFPILDPKYRIPEKDVEVLWNALPPFRTGEISGIANGKQINCAIISVPLTPQSLEDCSSSATKRADYARPRILQAASFAKKMGAKFIGLGETLASLTRHGKILQSQFPEIKVTTGHAFTTHFMTEWTQYAAKAAGIKLEDSQITIIGAGGSIGKAMTEILLDQGVERLNLHDKENMRGVLEEKQEEISERYPNKKIKITAENDNLKEACVGSRIVLVAASAPTPFIKAEHLDKGTFIINDSQPPSITREEARKGNSVDLWVLAKLPEGFVDTFDSGLWDGDWTCALEVVALEVEGEKALETVGPVTTQRVKEFGEIAKKIGIGLASAQSWGIKEKNLQ